MLFVYTSIVIFFYFYRSMVHVLHHIFKKCDSKIRRDLFHLTYNSKYDTTHVQFQMSLDKHCSYNFLPISYQILLRRVNHAKYLRLTIFVSILLVVANRGKLIIVGWYSQEEWSLFVSPWSHRNRVLRVNSINTTTRGACYACYAGST